MAMKIVRVVYIRSKAELLNEQLRMSIEIYIYLKRNVWALLRRFRIISLLRIWRGVLFRMADRGTSSDSSSSFILE